MTEVAVCIPTVDRPESVRALLGSLAEQELMPDVIVVVDGTGSPETEQVCDEFRRGPSATTLWFERSERGLTRQRRHAIDTVRYRKKAIDYICFLDDDVRLDPTFLSTIVQFMES